MNRNYLDRPESPIHLNPDHRGKFTEWARQHGFRNVQLAVRHVLANHEHYSEEVIRMATFAHNARDWKHVGATHHGRRDNRREESRKHEDTDRFGFDEDEETPDQERYEQRHGGDGDEHDYREG